MNETIMQLLVDYQEVIVGAIVWGLMWLIMRRWTNLQDAEITKLRQALTAGAMAAIGIVLTDLAAHQPVEIWTAIGEAFVAWWIAMGLHAGGKRLKGAVT